MSHHLGEPVRNSFPFFFAIFLRHARFVLIASLVATIAVIWYSARNLTVDTDLTRMMSSDLPFRRHEKAFRKAFPQLSDAVVVVVEADAPEGAAAARKKLAARLRDRKELFTSVYEPGGGDYFDRNGLLYLDTRQLEDLADSLANVQPLLALLAEDLSLRQLFSVLRQATGREGEEAIPPETVNKLFRALGDTFYAVLQGKNGHLSWQELMAINAAGVDERRQLIIATPAVQPEGLDGAAPALDAIRSEAKRVGIGGSDGVRIRLTGDVPLGQENLVAIRSNIGLAMLASVMLVGVALAVAVRGSLRLVAANLITLVAGFVWTLGFAVVAVGSLNLISVTFGVLYIGLGIDFSLLLSLRYTEHLGAGKNNEEAIAAAVAGSAKGLFLCAATAAIGFYSFVPTAYAGASDLGVISGTGMFINLLVTLTLLPALFAVFPVAQGAPWQSRWTLWTRMGIAAVPYQYARAVVIAAAAVGIASIAVAPSLTFDYNPLNLYNPVSEPVTTAKELFKTSGSSPWTISVLAQDADEARSLAARLAEVREVDNAVTLADFVPQAQEEKLAIVTDMALFMPPVPEDLKIRHERPERFLPELSGFRAAVSTRYLSGGASNPDARRLYDLIGRVEERLRSSGEGEALARPLEEALLANLPVLLERLELSLQAEEVTEKDLPRELREQYVASDGRQRVQVFPRENISTPAPLERFVRAVQRIAPAATDAPVSILEAGRAVVASFRQASLYALVAITLFLLVALRSVRMTLLVLLPFALAFLMTAASSVVFGVPLNFANIIVLPLLLGLGIDNDIHLVHRYRTEPPANGNLLETSTSRAVVFSTITNVMGFGTLSWMPHRGLASMGILLTLCMTYLILATLLVLPALLELFGGGPGLTPGKRTGNIDES